MPLPPLTVLLEGHRWVVVSKPAGIATERHFDHDTVEARAQVQWKRPGSEKPAFVGIVHRLDRPVSGALLLARNKSTLRALNEAFAAGRTRKVYWALTAGPLPRPAGQLTHYLHRDRTGRRALAATRPLPGAKESTLSYRLLRRVDDDYLYEVRPRTGRFHQIRVQLATAGASIIGDVSYGSDRFAEPHTIRLHARSLSFTTPAGEKISVTAPLPPGWPALLTEEE